MPIIPIGIHIPERNALGGDKRNIAKGIIPKSIGIKLIIIKRHLLIGS